MYRNCLIILLFLAPAWWPPMVQAVIDALLW